MCRRLLCYGDSNTYGYDPRSYLGGRYPQSVRWTALLRDMGGTLSTEEKMAALSHAVMVKSRPRFSPCAARKRIT